MANLSTHAKGVLKILRDSPEPLSAEEITARWTTEFGNEPLPYGGIEMILVRLRPYLIEKAGKYTAKPPREELSPTAAGS